MRLHRGDAGSHGPRHVEIPVCTTRSPAPSLFLTTRRLKAGSGDVPARTRSRGPTGRHPYRLGPPCGSVPPGRNDWRLTEAGSGPEAGCPAAPLRPRPPRRERLWPSIPINHCRGETPHCLLTGGHLNLSEHSGGDSPPNRHFFLT